MGMSLEKVSTLYFKFMYLLIDQTTKYVEEIRTKHERLTEFKDDEIERFT